MGTKATDHRPQFFLIEDAVVEKCNLDPYAGWLYVVIAKHADRKTGEAFPGIARLAKLANMSRSQVLRAIKTLEEKKLIRVERDELPNKGEKRQREKNHYFLLSAEGSTYQELGVVPTGNYPNVSQELGVVSGVDRNKNQLEPESNNTPVSKDELDLQFDCIAETWNNKAGGWVSNMQGMIFVSKKVKGTWKACEFDPPATIEEVRAFGIYGKKRARDGTLPTMPDTIQRWFYDFRTECVREAARKITALTDLSGWTSPEPDAFLANEGA